MTNTQKEKAEKDNSEKERKISCQQRNSVERVVGGKGQKTT